MVLGAVSGIETSSLRSSLGKSKQPRRHRADTCAWSRPGAGAEPLPTRQASARFRPRTMTDSPALHPLHSTAAIRKQRRSAIASFRRPQTGETVRKRRARPKKGFQRPRCSAYRPRPAIARDASHGQDTAIRREAPPVAEDKQYGREASPGKDISNNREHGHFPTATLRWRSVSPFGKLADLTDKTNLV